MRFDPLPGIDPARAGRALDILAAMLKAIDPAAATVQALDTMGVPNLVTVIGLGKAAAAMARGAHSSLGSRITSIVVASDHEEEVPSGAELIYGSHPVPDRTSERAGLRLLAAAETADEPVLFLISGGGSAAAEVPADGLRLAEVADTHRLLLQSGLPIEEMNTVRTHISAIKGGRLAAAARQPSYTILISDVGSRPELVASGPTVPAHSSPEDALSIIIGSRLDFPPGVVRFLRDEASNPPTVKGDLRVAADWWVAAGAAKARAEALGLSVYLAAEPLVGDAATSARTVVASAPPGVLSIHVGETTVEVTGGGTGGRNQEAALAAALAIEDTGVSFVSFGTDGVDGPTDAAGAVVNGSTAGRIRAAGIDPEAALADNDSHRALAEAGSLVRCGPTGTNVADLWMVDRT